MKERRQDDIEYERSGVQEKASKKINRSIYWSIYY